MQSERESCCGIISTTSRLIICESAFKNCTSAAVKNDLDSWSSCDKQMASGPEYPKKPEYSMSSANSMDQLMQGPLVAWV